MTSEDTVQGHEGPGTPPGHAFRIQIDREHYKVTQKTMTGLELRRVPPTPIGPDRDLFEVVPGGTDKKIGDKDVVEIRDGKRFFTAPAQINPGRGPCFRRMT
ncbi:MAG: multiubiquitin domain-containing protein [Planctomycetota bacterium]